MRRRVVSVPPIDPGDQLSASTSSLLWSSLESTCSEIECRYRNSDGPVCGTSLDTHVAAPLTSGCPVRDIVSLLFTNEFSLGDTGGAPLLVERSDVQVHQALHDLIGAYERGSDQRPHLFTLVIWLFVVLL